MKDKQGKPMPNATPSVPDGSELDVSLYQPEGMLNYIENISLFMTLRIISSRNLNFILLISCNLCIY